MAGRFTLGTVVMTALVIGAAGAMFAYQAITGSPKAAPPTAAPAENGPRLLKTEPVNPFPDATVIRVSVHGPAPQSPGDKGEPAQTDSVRELARLDRPLTAEERSTFESTLHLFTYASTPDADACFIPHHYFEYFDSSGRKLGEVQICFCCGGMDVKGWSHDRMREGQVLVFDRAPLIAFIKGLGLPTNVGCGKDTPDVD